MKANVIVAEMDPSRIDVVRRALTHEVIPHLRAQPGSGCGHWMVNCTTGELLVLTTWDDDEALTAGLAADRTHRGNLAERAGLEIRAHQTMEVLGSTDLALTLTPAARWVHATWVHGLAPTARPSETVVDEQPAPGFCGSYWLGEPATGAGLVLRFWARPAERRTGDAGRHREPERDQRLTVVRTAVYESIGTADARRADAGDALL